MTGTQLTEAHPYCLCAEELGRHAQPEPGSEGWKHWRHLRAYAAVISGGHAGSMGVLVHLRF
jgi:predicted Rossmann-fold nucleotide-binding protein